MRYLLLALFASLATGSARAQTYEGSLRFGGTATTFVGERTRLDETAPMTGTTAFEFDHGGALTGSGGLRVRFPNGFAIGADVAYVLARAETDAEALLRPGGDLEPVRVEFQLTSLHVPVLARYTLQTLSSVHPMIAAGGYVGRLNEARESLSTPDGDLIVERISLLDDDTPSFETWDYGIAAEVGAEIDVAGERIEAALRLDYGLADVQRQTTSEVFTRTLSFTLGFLF